MHGVPKHLLLLKTMPERRLAQAQTTLQAVLHARASTVSHPQESHILPSELEQASNDLGALSIQG